ncbi:AT-rich interactive domain-containing protein 5 [Linum grandiflorum]
MEDGEMVPVQEVTGNDVDVDIFEESADLGQNDQMLLQSETAAVGVVVMSDDYNCILTVDAASPTTSAPATEHATPQPLIRYSRSKHGSSSNPKGAWTDLETGDTEEAGTLEERETFMRELEDFHRDNRLVFNPPKFYREPLNCLKLWRTVIKLGGYDVVTASKSWRDVGVSFHPPKTCTTVSWSFRIFYEKALLKYERHKRKTGELDLPDLPQPQIVTLEKETSDNQVAGPVRTRRDAAVRAMERWHDSLLIGYGEDKSTSSVARHEKPLKNIASGLLTYETTNEENVWRPANIEAVKELDVEIVDIGPAADWVKINVRETEDGFEVNALVPGLLPEEVRVQSDPAGRLVITGQPEQLENPWGITPFKKVVILPARIDPLQTSAVVSLHGRLYVRIPFEQTSI